MSFSGGVYTLPGPALVTGEVVSATENNQFRNDVAGAFNLTFLRNGTSTATANLPMGGYKLTGLGVATTSGDALSYGQAATVSNITASGTVTISSGTANGVAYLNGSKVLTTGSALTFDGGMLALSGSGNIARFGDGTNTFDLRFRGANNWSIQYAPSTDEWALQRNSVNQYSANSSSHIWSLLAAEQMRLTSTGLGIGTSSPSQPLQVTKSQNASTWAYVTNGSNGSGAATGLLFGTDQGTSGAISQNSSGNSDVAANALRIRNLLNAPISFEINSSTKALLDSSGNLGLGVTPSANSLSKGIDLVGGAGLFGYANQTELTTNAYFDSAWKYKSNGYACIYETVLGQHIWKTAPSGTAGNAISFTQAMTLDASGNLGIGTSSPAQLLTLNGPSPIIQLTDSDTGGYCYINASSTAGSLTLHADQGNTLANSSMNFVVDATERMRIDSSGNLLVGTTAPIGSQNGITVSRASSAYVNIQAQNSAGWDSVLYLECAGSFGATIQAQRSSGLLRIWNGSGTAGVTLSSGGTSWGTFSDERLKDIVEPIENAAQKVSSLRAVIGRYKTDDETKRRPMLIAQDVQKVLPEAVYGDKSEDDYLSLAYADTIPLLVAAIQELKAELDETKAEVAALKGN